MRTTYRLLLSLMVALVTALLFALTAGAVSERGGARGGGPAWESGVQVRGASLRSGRKAGQPDQQRIAGQPLNLPAWVPSDLQVGQWFRIDGTNLASFTAAVDTDAQAQGWQSAIPTGNRSCELRAFSGFATNPAGTKVFVHGGGHSSSWRNDILQIDLSSDAPAWSTRQAATSWNVINQDFRDPGTGSPLAAAWDYPPITEGERGARKKDAGVAGLWHVFRSDGSVAEWSGKYPDDAPVSSHTAQRNLYNADKDAFYNIAAGVGTLGGGLFLQNLPNGAATKSWSVVKHASGAWSYPVPVAADNPNGPEYATAPMFTYTSPTAKYRNIAYIWASDHYADIFKFDTDTEQWTRLGVQVSTAWNDSQAMLGYDHTRNRLLAINNAGAWIVDLTQTPPTKTAITIAGKFNVGSANLLYDEREDRFVFVQGTTIGGSVKVYAIDAALTTPAVVQLSTTLHGAHTPATQNGRDNYGTFLIPDYGLLVWQANGPTSPVANDCHFYALKLHEPVGQSLDAQWESLVTTLNGSGKLIAAEGFDSTPIRGAIKRVDSPCDAGFSTIWNDQYVSGNRRGCFGYYQTSDIAGGLGTAQTGTVYRSVWMGARTSGYSPEVANEKITVPLTSPRTAPTLGQTPFSDDQQWPYSPAPDPARKLSGDGALRFTYSKYYAESPGYGGRMTMPNGNYNQSTYTAATGGKYIIYFCNDWDPDCPNRWTLQEGGTKDIWIRLSYFVPKALFHAPDPVPQWMQTWCTNNPLHCPNAIQPGDPISVMAMSASPGVVDMWENQMKGHRWMAWPGRMCRHTAAGGGNYNENAAAAPSSGNNYSCHTLTQADGDGFMASSFNPLYINTSHWNGWNYLNQATSRPRSADQYWTDAEKTVYARFPNAAYFEDYAATTPNITVNGVLASNQWTWTLNGPWPAYTDFKVGDAWIFRPTSCSGISCNTTQWTSFQAHVDLDTIVSIDNSNPNAPVVVTTANGRSGQSGTATAEVHPYCDSGNPKLNRRVVPMRSPGCKIWGKEGSDPIGQWVTVLYHLYYRADTVQEPEGACATQRAEYSSNCTKNRFGNSASSSESPAWIETWVKEEGREPRKIQSAPFGVISPYRINSVINDSSVFVGSGQPVPLSAQAPGLGGFWIDHAFFYTMPATFWGGETNSTFSKPNDNMFITVENLLIVKNMATGWGDSSEAWKGAP